MIGKFKFMMKQAAAEASSRLAHAVRPPSERGFPKDMDGDFRPIYEMCRADTMTSRERMYALYQAVEYIVRLKVPGDLVECGVWRGGSAMLIARTLLKLGDTGRRIYLYDTFAGMTEPTEKDRSLQNGERAIDTWKHLRSKGHNRYCFAPLDTVKSNMRSTNYPADQVVFVPGKVEETLSATMPTRISLLRLDTDWFESTYHELNCLYPLLSKDGVIIIDDYGHWTGAKDATDRYFSENGITMLLNRIDYTGRSGIKTSSDERV